MVLKRASGRRPSITSNTVLILSLLLGACASFDNLARPQEETLELRTAAAGSVTKRINSGDDDTEEVASGVMYAPSPRLEIVKTANRGLQTVGLRFEKITVPRGAIITRAYLQFTASTTSAGRVKASIRGIGTDSAPRFSGRSRHLSARAKTSRRVNWDVAAWRAGESGVKQRTPNLSGVVQELVDRRGWRSGNAIAFTLQGSSGDRSAKAYEGNSGEAPLLHIEYEMRTADPDDKGGGKGSGKGPGAGVPIIFDTDYGFDVDDVGALAVLHALADSGEADLLATITTVTDPYVPGAMDAVNTFYGRPDIPLGQNTSAPAHYRWNKAHPYWRRPAPHFVVNLAKEFSHDTGRGRGVTSAVALYRKTLAAQPDNSVTIVAVGFMKNLAELLKSDPDGYSHLSGEELVDRKVKQLVVMGGSYPDSDGDFNLTSGPGRDASDAQWVLEAWPTETVFTPGNVCGDVPSGQTLTNPRNNPVARAYELFFGRQRVGRASWDLCAVLYAVRGLRGPTGDTYFKMSSGERLILYDSGRNAWVSGRSRHKRLVRVTSPATIENILNKLLTQPPR